MAFFREVGALPFKALKRVLNELDHFGADHVAHPRQADHFGFLGQGVRDGVFPDGQRAARQAKDRADEDRTERAV
ncbi:MAG: hypothetical protein ACREV3_01740 [Gammaproteobacteria bacterium]